MLLMDLLSKATNIMNVDPSWVPTLKRALDQSQKFELAPDFAAAAEVLAADFNAIEKALPYCRLPYKQVWLEVAQMHRPRFAAAPIHVPAIQRVPIRVGFLLHAVNEDNSIIDVYEFWVLRTDPNMVQASNLAMRFDPREASNPREPVELDDRSIFGIKSSDDWKRASPTAKRILNNVIQPLVAPYLDASLQVALESNPVVGQYGFELGAADWSGETAYLLSVLALVNTVNATIQSEVDQSRINRKRVSRKEAPLNDHYVLNIHPRIKRSMVGRGHGATAGEVRLHLVRGHFKVRKTGIYWWNQHPRGSGDTPIDKSYKVR